MAPSPALREPAQDVAPPRRRLAPNVIALWPDDRPPIANQRHRGRYPKGVQVLRRHNRLRPGVFAYLWNDCLPANRGAVVQLIEPKTMQSLYGGWTVRAISRPLVERDLDTGAISPGSVGESFALETNLRRCAAPKCWGAMP